LQGLKQGTHPPFTKNLVESKQLKQNVELLHEEQGEVQISQVELIMLE